MDIQIAILFIIIGVSTVMFITEIFSVDKIAFLVMVSLFMCNLITGEEAISGFSNPAVITIVALMIITAALEYNGSIGLLSDALMPIIKLPLYFSLPLMMLFVGGFSAFISTTAVVILFVRIMPEVSKRYNIPIEKYMMPISFAGILGGSCTLMGTSTNLIVSQIAVSKGMPAFEFFEITSVAICLLVLGIVITSILSTILLNKKDSSYSSRKPLPRYISLFRVLQGNPIIGQAYKTTDLYKDKRVRILQIRRQNKVIRHPSYWTKFKEGDVIILSTVKDHVLSLISNPHYEAISENDYEGSKDFTGAIIELLILPDSKLIGRSFGDLDTAELNGGMPLAMSKHRNVMNPSDKFIENKLSRVRIDPGDRLMIQLSGDEDNHWNLEDNNLIIEQRSHPTVHKYRQYLALGILALVILLAATRTLPILESTLLGVAVMLVTQTVTLQYAYQSINWQIVFLLVGLLPLGIAMQNTGADAFL